MNAEQRMVDEFQRKHELLNMDSSDGGYYHGPRLLNTPDLFRRARLIVTEAAEFCDAAGTANMVEMVDALADLLVVVYGTACEMGVDLEPVFAEVHRSNMSKNGGKDEGGKVLKGDTYSPPDIAGELVKQGWTP